MKKAVSAIICAALLLSGCSSATASSSSSSQTSEAASIPQASANSSSAASVVIDPPYEFDPNEMVPKDFGDYFAAEYPTEVSSYKLLEGTEQENEVVVLKGAEEGPVLYVVAGVHGDEVAGWTTGNLLKKIGIKAGTLYILSPANRWGAAAEPRTRFVTGEQDLNRSFPGSPEGNEAERVADAIYNDIDRLDPVFVFDLHEARVNQENRDFLGSSIIYTSLDGIDDMFLDMLMQTEAGTLCSERFNFFGPGPVGSINNVVTTNQKVPVITVETYRGYPLERRVSDQLALVQYVFRHYGLV